jgi:hypothetical protein
MDQDLGEGDKNNRLQQKCYRRSLKLLQKRVNRCKPLFLPVFNEGGLVYIAICWLLPALSMGF